MRVFEQGAIQLRHNETKRNRTRLGSSGSNDSRNEGGGGSGEGGCGGGGEGDDDGRRRRERRQLARVYTTALCSRRPQRPESSEENVSICSDTSLASFSVFLSLASFARSRKDNSFLNLFYSLPLRRSPTARSFFLLRR